MKSADSSVVVAGFATWHEKHAPVQHALRGDVRLVDQAALEAFSVLTRLPPPHRAPAELVRDFLARNFRRRFLRLDTRGYRTFVLSLAELGITGGAVYDALIATTAMRRNAILLTCDRRAKLVYDRVGVTTELI